MPERGGELGPLPAGRHNYSAEQVAHNQRERLLAALVEVVNERGYAAATVSHITAAAQVSRRTFYQQFKDKEACFMAAFDVIVERLKRVITEAIEESTSGPRESPPASARCSTFSSPSRNWRSSAWSTASPPGPEVAEHYRETVISLAPHLAAGRDAHEGGELPGLTEDTVIGGIASVISREIIAGRAADLGAFRGDFAAFVLTPYLGAERAKKFAVEASGG